MKLKIAIVISIIFISSCKLANTGHLDDSQNNSNGKIYKEDQSNITGTIVEIPSLAKLSLDELNGKLGQPEKDAALGSAGKVRMYDINKGEAELSVYYKDDKITEFKLRLAKLRETSDDLLKAGGFDLQGQKPDWENAIDKNYENRSFNGVRFESIDLTMSPPKQKWEEISARLRR